MFNRIRVMFRRFRANPRIKKRLKTYLKCVYIVGIIYIILIIEYYFQTVVIPTRDSFNSCLDFSEFYFSPLCFN